MIRGDLKVQICRVNPITGIEETMWSFQGETENEVIDYGNGTCDALASITLNGETNEVDLSLEEDDDDDDDDDDDLEDDDDDDTADDD